MAEKTAPKPTKSNPIPEPDHDRVVIASRRPDGSPAQSEGFEYIGPKEQAVAAAKAQLAEQAVSAVDVAVRGVTTDTGDNGEGSSRPDPGVQDIIDAHGAAVSAAESKAESEVNSAHKGLGA